MRSALRGLLLALLTLGTALVVAACAGRASVKDQYLKRSRDVAEKYDQLAVPANAELVGAGPLSCSDFIGKLKSKYTYWRPGDAGTSFCQHKSTVAGRRDFELHARAMHNKGISVSKSKRLAHLTQLYKEASRAETGSAETPIESPRARPVSRPMAAVRPSRRTAQPAPSAQPAPVNPKLPGKGGELLPYAQDSEDDEQAIQAMENLDSDEPLVATEAPAPAAKRPLPPVKQPVAPPASGEYEAGDELKSGPLSEYE